MAGSQGPFPGPDRQAWSHSCPVEAAWVSACAGMTEESAVGRLSKDRDQ